MKSIQFYPSDILRDISEKLSPYFQHIYPENRPLVSEPMDEMLVISFPINFDDNHVCQNTDIRFEIIVKNNHNGIPKIEKLQEMLNLLVGQFPIIGERYVAYKPYLALKGEDEAGFTIWAVQAEIRVNTTDRYDIGRKKELI